MRRVTFSPCLGTDTVSIVSPEPSRPSPTSLTAPLAGTCSAVATFVMLATMAPGGSTSARVNQPIDLPAPAQEVGPPSSAAASPSPVLSSGAESLEMTHLFPATSDDLVLDEANVFGQEQHGAIESTLGELGRLTGADVRVVTLPSLGPHAPPAVAEAIGRTWRVGGRLKGGSMAGDAGVIILLVPRTSSHAADVGMMIGAGLISTIDQGRVGEIREAMLPAMSESQYARAIDLGVGMVSASIESLLRPPEGQSTLQPGTSTVSPPKITRADPDTNSYSAEAVDSPVAYLRGPRPRFPSTVGANVSDGRVVLTFVVAANGRVEEHSVTVVSSSLPELTPFAIDVVKRSVYKPAVLRGLPVRQQVQQAVSFTR